MTAWRLRIEGVGDIMARYPEEESRLDVIGREVAGVIRENVRQAKKRRSPIDGVRARGIMVPLTARDTIGLDGVLDEMAALPEDATETDFGDLMDRIYDWADDFGVWIEPPS